MKLCIVFLLASAVVAAYANAIDFDRDLDVHWNKYKVSLA